jgi:predicted dehydrogenase
MAGTGRVFSTESNAVASPFRFGLVGTGWRGEFFARLARLMPDRLELAGAVVRHPAKADEVARRWGVPVLPSPAELMRRQRPEFVISSVPRGANEAVVCELVDAGAHVLAETPPAPDLAALRRLWGRVGALGRVQVAEQYPLLPGHAARQALVRRGVIGRPGSVQVSSTHGYHAVALMRSLLGVGFGPVGVSATRFTAPLVDPLNRSGWTDDARPKLAGTVLATLDFGSASGLYDFTDNQWHNQLRLRRILIRGSHGEISDDAVVHLSAPRTIVKSALRRSQLGYDLNLDGYDTEHIAFEGEVVWRNPFLGLRLMDEEIAIATMLIATGRWARDGGPPPYPLAHACQDHLVALAIDEAVASGRPVTTDAEPWHVQSDRIGD